MHAQVCCSSSMQSGPHSAWLSCLRPTQKALQPQRCLYPQVSGLNQDACCGLANGPLTEHANASAVQHHHQAVLVACQSAIVLYHHPCNHPACQMLCCGFAKHFRAGKRELQCTAGQNTLTAGTTWLLCVLFCVLHMCYRWSGSGISCRLAIMVRHAG